MRDESEAFTFILEFIYMFVSLKKKTDFEKVAKNGRPFFTHQLGFKILPNHLAYNRYGIVINLKIDKRAVVRNKLRRQIKAVLRTHQPKLKTGWDIMILMRESIKELKYQEIEEKLLELFKKARLF